MCTPAAAASAAVQVSMLKALAPEKVPADFLVGPSVDAINAAFSGVPTRAARQVRTLLLIDFEVTP